MGDPAVFNFKRTLRFQWVLFRTAAEDCAFVPDSAGRAPLRGMVVSYRGAGPITASFKYTPSE